MRQRETVGEAAKLRSKLSPSLLVCALGSLHAACSSPDDDILRPCVTSRRTFPPRRTITLVAYATNPASSGVLVCAQKSPLMEASLPWEDGDPPDASTDGARLFGAAPGGDQALLLCAVLQQQTDNCGRWRGGDAVMVLSSSSAPHCGSCARILPTRRCAGHGCEVPGNRDHPGDAHEVAGYQKRGAAAYEQMQLDLGLTAITEFFSYSKLWRMLYFVNDAPFRIRNDGKVAGE